MSVANISLQTLIGLMAANGASQFYAKRLAENDNSKNQVYFGPGFSALNVFPTAEIRLDRRANSSNYKAAMHFFWVTDELQLSEAPYAQIILYPQYPEVRFSGFLKGSQGAPSDLMRARLSGRVLFFGVCEDGRVIGYVDSADSAIVRQFAELGPLQQNGVFEEILIDARPGITDTRMLLLEELSRINRLGWIDSKRLGANGQIMDCLAPNCGGYTLEAELGITPNGYSEPDYLGWEIKQHAVTRFNAFNSGSPITLMTPEPTVGYYVEEGVIKFVQKYGYADTLGRADRINFGGRHKADLRNPRTNLTLTIVGYDRETNKIVDTDGGIYLLSDNEELAAGWQFQHILAHWSRKHNKAAYVPSMSRLIPHRQYSYGPTVHLGEGADPLLLLKALSNGMVYYDPGIKVENLSTHPVAKRRSQFRIHPRSLGALYARMVEQSVI